MYVPLLGVHKALTNIIEGETTPYGFFSHVLRWT
jgi:hypothetical protein